MTTARKAVLDILSSAAEPLSSSEVFNGMGGSVDPVTVYRTLHYLEENGYADSFVLHCEAHGTERYYTAVEKTGGNTLSHRHWFHCEHCHRFTDLGSCKLEKLVRGYEREQKITVKTHTLYLTGICAACERNSPVKIR